MCVFLSNWSWFTGNKCCIVLRGTTKYPWHRIFSCVNTNRLSLLLLVSKVYLIVASPAGQPCGHCILFVAAMCEGVDFFFLKPLASTNSKLLLLVGQEEMRNHKEFFPYYDHKLHLYVFLNFGYPSVVKKNKKCLLHWEIEGCMVEEDMLRETLLISHLAS